jgi:putative transposase
MVDKLTIHRKVSPEEFDRRIVKEKKTKIRKKLRALKIVNEGHSARYAAAKFYLSSQTVERAVRRFNDHGWDGLQDQYRGRVPQMTAEEEDELRNRILDGPTKDDKVRVFHGKDIHRILKDEFGIDVHFRTTYKILNRIGLSSLTPRTQNPKSDIEIQRTFKKTSKNA